MLTAARAIAALPGILMVASAFNWLANPTAAAENLGMPLLDGIGRSSQVGDFTAFFLSASIMIFIGIYRANAAWLYAPALLLGTAAVGRIFAYLFHEAPLAGVFIGVEVVCAGLLIACGRVMSRHSMTESA
jgi:hypothetical protein